MIFICCQMVHNCTILFCFLKIYAASFSRKCLKGFFTQMQKVPFILSTVPRFTQFVYDWHHKCLTDSFKTKVYIFRSILIILHYRLRWFLFSKYKKLKKLFWMHRYLQIMQRSQDFVYKVQSIWDKWDLFIMNFPHMTFFNKQKITCAASSGEGFRGKWNKTENEIKLYLFIPAYDVERDIRYIEIRKWNKVLTIAIMRVIIWKQN